MAHLKVLPYLLGIGVIAGGLMQFPVVAMAVVTSTTIEIDKDVTDNSTPPHVIGHILSTVQNVYKLMSVSSLPCCTTASMPASNPPRLGERGVVSTDRYSLVESDLEVRTQNFDFDDDLASRFKSLVGYGSKKSWQKVAGKGTSTMTGVSNTLHCGQRYELWIVESTRTQTETVISANKKIGIRTSTTRTVGEATTFLNTNDRWDPSTQTLIEGTPCTIPFNCCTAPEPKPASETPK